MKVWIVEGSTGEYEDRREWIVKAFVSKEHAMSLRTKLESVLKEEELHRENMGLNYDDIPDKLLQLDPHASVDYTGASYSLYSIDVEE